MDHETFVWLARSRSWLAEHFDERVRLEMAAQEAYMSPFHYHRLFSRAFSETPHEFVTRLRLEHAKKLIRSSDLTISEICMEVGYGSLGTFSSMFSRHEGCSPVEFRRVYSMPQAWTLKVVPSCMLSLWAVPR
ncbi:MAG: helix-turn-helix domain-containing protein [Fimbriimonas sp.]